ncbi:MAG: KamA family radical SAM protein [Spirochaetales bacterium]|nr:KamA family radical SAM protein [Spirochaetales bacterium]
MKENNENSWNDELKGRLKKRSQLEEYIELEAAQAAWFTQSEEKGDDILPFMTSRYYLETALAAGPDGRAAILRQIIPSAEEFVVKDYELSDPLGEAKYSPAPRLVHCYPDRALILVTDECAMFCRHCFRRSFTGGMKGALTDAELDPILEYFRCKPEISEVLLTGGDPLTLSDDRLKSIISRIKDVRPEMIIRLCTRMPVVLPSRITAQLVAMLGSYDGIWLVTHFNHPSEITIEAAGGIRAMRKAGVPVLNQTVLLRGVNDNLETLSSLFRRLLSKGVKPYYLFQGDLAAGTSHLRVPLEEALRLTAELKDLISGMAMPRFAVDLPGGGGKITLPSQHHQLEREGDFFTVKGLDNEQYRYPAN